MGFNGAAVFRPRKPPRKSAGHLENRAASTEPRSFDRGNSMTTGARKANGWASTEPRSFDRGNLPHFARAGCRVCSFNGAAVFRPRKPGRSAGCRPRWRRASTEPRSFDRGNCNRHVEPLPRIQASTEPRSFDRGNTTDSAGIARASSALQRSRGLSTAETGMRDEDETGPCGASTEPRSFDRGNRSRS